MAHPHDKKSKPKKIQGGWQPTNQKVFITE
jgi:hypothetical protein